VLSRVGNDDHRSVARHSWTSGERRSEIGDEVIGAIVHAERSRIAKGDGVSFREKRHFLEHLRQPS
jgi:hypothetical protein